MLLKILRATLICAATLFPSLVAAQCVGTGYWDQLSKEDQAELSRAADATPYGTGNLWQARRDGTTLTILGTMHLPDPRHDAVLTSVLPALEAAELLLVEATLEDQTDMQVYMSRNPDLMTITSGPTLPDLVDAETWAAIENAARARGVPGFMAAKMQPWFLSMTLALPPCAMTAMVRGDAGIDNMLMTTAEARGIPVAPLEPWEDMLDLLQEGTLEEQLDALRLSLIDPAVQDAIILSLMDFYFAERAALSWQLGYAMGDSLPGLSRDDFNAQMAQMEQSLLIDRNAKWIPVIEAAAADHDRIFIGFGAAHLFADTGVLALLEAEGWTVSPL